MDASGGGASRVRKIEEEDSKKDAKPVKTLNRVPRMLLLSVSILSDNESTTDGHDLDRCLRESHSSPP